MGAIIQAQWVKWLRKFADDLEKTARDDDVWHLQFTHEYAQDHATILRCLAKDLEATP